MDFDHKLWRYNRTPDEGIPIADLIAAMREVEAADEVGDKRVLGVRLHQNGSLLVTTGESIGGYMADLRRKGSGWEVAAWTMWCS